MWNSPMVGVAGLAGGRDGPTASCHRQLAEDFPKILIPTVASRVYCNYSSPLRSDQKMKHPIWGASFLVGV